VVQKFNSSKVLGIVVCAAQLSISTTSWAKWHGVVAEKEQVAEIIADSIIPPSE
jgi:hypothetical protein